MRCPLLTLLVLPVPAAYPGGSDMPDAFGFVSGGELRSMTQEGGGGGGEFMAMRLNLESL